MTLTDFISQLPKNAIEPKKIYQGQNMLQTEGDGTLIRYTAKYFIYLVLKMDCETNAKITLINRYKDKVETKEFTWSFEEVLDRWKHLEDMCRICSISGVKFDFDRLSLLGWTNE